MILSLFALCFVGSTIGLECGKSKYHDAGNIKKLTTPLIIGGKEARAHEFPWQVRILVKKTNKYWKLCGGSIINERWVLTAAHCTENITKSTLKVIVGEYKADVDNPNRQVIYAENIYTHPNRSPDKRTYDLSLIETKKAIKFNENVLPVCLPKPNDLSVNRKVVVSGWGRIKFPDGRFANYLKYVILNTMTNKDCKKVYYRVTDDMVCAKDKRSSDKRSSALGDSGGPVVFKDAKGIFSIVGVVSWGCNCSQNKPSVFARVTSALDWITETSSIVSVVSSTSDLYKHFYIITTILITNILK